MNNKKIGTQGEQSAVNFLLKNKYSIIERNFKTKIGEIDIIAKDKETLVFIEVKTRSSTAYGLPCESVNYYKQNTICKVAHAYLAKNKLNNQNCRFDIIEVLKDKEQQSYINHVKDAFQPKIF